MSRRIRLSSVTKRVVVAGNRSQDFLRLIAAELETVECSTVLNIRMMMMTKTTMVSMSARAFAACNTYTHTHRYNTRQMREEKRRRNCCDETKHMRRLWVRKRDMNKKPSLVATFEIYAPCVCAGVYSLAVA